MRWPGFLAAAVFLVLGLVVLQDTLLGDRVLSSAQVLARRGPFPAAVRDAAPEAVPLGTDAFQQFEPWLRHAADRLARDGRLPLWKDTTLCGAPLVGNGQSALFFPSNLLAALLGAPPRTQAVLALVKLVVGALTAFLLARHLRITVPGALLAGVSYGFYGFQPAYLLFPHTNVSMLLPLLVLVTDRLVLRPGGARLVAVALVCALQHYGGHPETAFHSQVVAALLALVRVAAGGRGRPARDLLQPVAAVAGAYVLGALLAGPQLLPLVEYIRHSDMLGRRVEEAVSGTLQAPLAAVLFLACLLVAALAVVRLARDQGPPLAWGGLLLAATFAGISLGMPAGLQHHAISPLSVDWLGGPARQRLGGPYTGAAAGYVGPALALAMVGVLACPRRGLVRVLAGVTLLTMLVGHRAPVLHDLLALLPLFEVAANERFVLLAVLGVALLAGLGLDALAAPRSAPRGRRRLLALALGASLGVAGATALAAWRGELVPLPPLPRLSLPQAQPFPVSWKALAPEQDGEQVFEGTLQLPEEPRRIELLFMNRRAFAEHWPQENLPGDKDGWQRHGFRVAVGAWRVPSRDMRLVLLVLGYSGQEYVSGPEAPWRSLADRLSSYPFFPSDGRAGGQLLVFALTLGVSVWQLGRSSSVGRLLLPGLAVAGLGSFAVGLAPTLAKELHFPPSPALDLLREARPDGRVVFFRHNYLGEAPAWYDVPIATGYDALHPRHVATLLREALDRPTRDSPVQHLPQRDQPDLRLLGLLSVRGLAGYEGRDARHLPYPGEEDLGVPFPVAENPHWLPRARLVHNAFLVHGDDLTLQGLKDPAMDHRRQVLLAQGQPIDSPGEPGTATIVRDEAGRVVVAVEPTAPSYLVLADTFFPGWTAWVDGEVRPIHRANLAFRAVGLLPGDRQVVFAYQPLSFRRGIVLAVAALALCALLAWGWRSGAPADPGGGAGPPA